MVCLVMDGWLSEGGGGEGGGSWKFFLVGGKDDELEGDSSSVVAPKLVLCR